MTGRQQARERERQAARENRDSTIGAGQHGNNQQGQQPGAPRQNEYFVPRDGIDREVITADICRYLGNDALVRPGTYEHDDGRTTQGYFITAYRNLTSAMIQDLKADSARWDQERRASSRATAGGSTTGGTLNSSLSNGLFVRNSNSPAAQSRNADYRGSETHQNRQYYGPSMDQPYGDPMAIDSYGSAPASNLRYPGTGNQGYNGVNSGTPYGAQQPYGAQGGYPQSAGQPYANPQAYQPNPQDRYQGMSTVGQPYGGHPSAVVTEAPFVSGSNFSSATMQSTLQAPAPSGFMDYSRDSRMPSGSSASTLPVYATTSGARPGYPTGADPNAPYYQPAPPQPLDAFYGRGNQAQTGYSTVQDPQYEEPRPPSHPSVPPAVTQTQVAPSGSTTTTTARREPRGERADRERTGERESDRHATERHERRHRNRP